MSEEPVKFSVHVEDESDAISTRYLYNQCFTVEVYKGEEVEEFSVALVYEELVMSTDDPRDTPRCNLIEIDVDSIDSESLAKKVKEKIEQWAKAHGIHIPSKAIKV